MNGNGPPLTPWLNRPWTLKSRIRDAQMSAEVMNDKLRGIASMVENAGPDHIEVVREAIEYLDKLVEELQRNHSGASVLADGLASVLPPALPREVM